MSTDNVKEIYEEIITGMDLSEFIQPLPSQPSSSYATTPLTNSQFKSALNAIQSTYQYTIPAFLGQYTVPITTSKIKAANHINLNLNIGKPMTRTSTRTENLTITEKLGIMSVSPDLAIKQLILAWKARMPVCLIGPTGQGKSAAISEAAEQLRREALKGELTWEVPCSLLNWSVRENYKKIYKSIKDKGLTSRDVGFTLMTTNPATKDAFDYTGLPGVDEESKEQFYYKPNHLPTNPYMLGMWQITEMNRPSAKRSIRPLLDVFQSRTIDEHVIPPGINIVADFNEGDVYDTDEIMDPFFIRRASFIFVETSFTSWKSWMSKKFRNSLVLEYLKTKPHAFDNDQARQQCQVYACPATWTRVQEILDTLEDVPISDMIPLLSGMVRREFAHSFIEFVTSGSDLSPIEILENYDKVQDTVRKYANQGRAIDVLPTTAFSALDIIKNTSSVDIMYSVIRENFVKFFNDLPLETSQAVMMELLPEKSGKVLNQNFEDLTNDLLEDDEAHSKIMKIHSIVNLGPRVESGALESYEAQRTEQVPF